MLLWQQMIKQQSFQLKYSAAKLDIEEKGKRGSDYKSEEELYKFQEESVSLKKYVIQIMISKKKHKFCVSDAKKIKAGRNYS